MSKPTNTTSRFSSDEAKSHLTFLFGQFSTEELRDIRQALNELIDLIDGQREQAAGPAESVEDVATA